MLYLLNKIISELKLNYQETWVEHDGKLNQVTSARAKDLVKWNSIFTGLKIDLADKILWYETPRLAFLDQLSFNNLPINLFIIYMKNI